MFTLPDDPYVALGVSHNAQIPEIRSAHRKLVLKCHPDKVTDPALKAAKQEEFQKVQKAYELLSDEKERQKYDDMRQANELEKENAERRKQRDHREFTPSRTTPRYDSESARNPHHKMEPSFKIRTAEPPPAHTKSATFPPPHTSSNSPYVSLRTPPRSFEDNIHHGSFDDVPIRRSKKSSVVYEERFSSRHDERRGRKKDDDAWERLPEKTTRRKDQEGKEQDRKEQKPKERRREDKKKAGMEKEKLRDQEHRKEIDEKRNRGHKTAYVEEDDYIAQNVSPGKPEKKSKSGGRIKETASKELPLDRELKQNSHIDFATQYLARSRRSPALSRAQTYHHNMRQVSPPPATPTPPPAAAGVGAFFEEDESVRRSSARRRMSHDTPRSKDKSTAHKKSSREPEYVDESVRHVPPLKKTATMPPSHPSTPSSVPESAPRFTRTQTDHYSRPVTGPMPPITRAATWRGDGGDAWDHSRSRHARGYSDDESEEDLRLRRSRQPRSPDDVHHSAKNFRYAIRNGRTVHLGRSDSYREESPVNLKAKHGYHEANISRPMEYRPSMASYGSYGSQVFQRVKTAKKYDPNDVVYADVPHEWYQGAEVFT